MGASNFMVGAIVSVYGLMSLLSCYVFGWVSDRKGRVGLIRAGLFASVLIFSLHLVAQTPAQLFTVRALCGMSLGIFYSSLVMYGIESGKKIGQYTAYESLGWGAGMLLAGVVAYYFAYAWVFALSCAFFLVSAVLSLGFGKDRSKRIKVPLLPMRIIRKNHAVYIPFLLRDIGAFSIWAFLPIYLSQLGADNLWIGILYFLNCGPQYVFKLKMDPYNYSKLFKFGIFTSAVAFFGYSLAGSYVHVIPVQIAVALAWSSLSIGAMGTLTRNNDEKATVIGLFSSSRSFARVLAPLIAGLITTVYEFRTLMMFAAAVTMLGLVYNIVFTRKL